MAADNIPLRIQFAPRYSAALHQMTDVYFTASASDNEDSLEQRQRLNAH